jgi:hypothetical protein
MPVASCTCSTVAPAQSAFCTSEPAVVRHARASSTPSSRPCWAPVERRSRDSSERSAFCSASVKLRPIAIASPTDFMCVVERGSAPGNFSNANRGTLTTT